MNKYPSEKVSMELDENNIYRKEYWLREYESGNIFILQYNTKNPALTYINDSYKVINSNNHWFNRRLELLIKSLRPSTVTLPRYRKKEIVEEITMPIFEKEVNQKVIKSNKEFVGLIIRKDLQKIHLLTDKDIEKYKIQKRNPITKALQNQHPMIQGSGSIFAGLYGFGDWAARISGFRDWQLDNIDDIEQDMATDETKYILKLIKYIFSNENGSFEIFANSVKKYIEKNPKYVTSRFLTGYGITKLTGTRIIPYTSITGQITFSAKEIDQFARNIILGK